MAHLLARRLRDWRGIHVHSQYIGTPFGSFKQDFWGRPRSVQDHRKCEVVLKLTMAVSMVIQHCPPFAVLFAGAALGQAFMERLYHGVRQLEAHDIVDQMIDRQDIMDRVQVLSPEQYEINAQGR
jgi:hypothetical protein